MSNTFVDQHMFYHSLGYFVRGNYAKSIVVSNLLALVIETVEVRMGSCELWQDPFFYFTKQ